MKIKKIFLPLVLALFFVNCDLEENILDRATTNNFIESSEDVQYLMNGAYQYLGSFGLLKHSAMWIDTWTGEDISAQHNTARQYLTRTRSASHNDFRWPFLSAYLLIDAANNLIVSLENANLPAADKERFLGEAYFLRGWSHFFLVRNYKQIPIKLTPTTGESNHYQPKDTMDDIYASILSDFEVASNWCIPLSEQPIDEGGRATKGTAQSFLALASLTWANYLDLNGRSSEAGAFYQQAVDMADTVISSGEYTLEMDFADLWNVQTQEASKEIVFAVQAIHDETNTRATARGTRHAVWTQPNNRFGVTGHNSNGSGIGRVRIQPFFYDRYTSGDYVGDYRTEVSFLTSWTNDVKGKEYYTYPETAPFVDGVTVFEPYPYIDKYRDTDGLGTWNHENDIVVMRYAEVFLIKAEAENELNGPTAKAFEAFNEVRKRARNADGIPRATPADLLPADASTKAEFRMKVLDERGLEFVGEAKRWFDLVRMPAPDNTRTMMEYMYVDVIPALPSGKPQYDTDMGVWSPGRVDPTSVAPYNERFVSWPIPAVELTSNPNFGGNNPGW